MKFIQQFGGGDSYKSKDGKISARLPADGLLTVMTDKPVFIEGLSSGNFGINLTPWKPSDEEGFLFTGGVYGDDSFWYRVGEEEDPRQYYVYSAARRDSRCDSIYEQDVQFNENEIFPVTLLGKGGDDTLIGMYLSDYISGGAGDDWLRGDQNGETPGGATVQGDTINGDDGIDYIVGLSGDDTLSGGADLDIIESNGGDGGNDILAGGDGGDTISGGTGNDFIVGDGYFDYHPVDFFADHAQTSVAYSNSTG